MRTCRHCGNGIEDRFRFCPWCAAPQRRKLVEFFAPHPDVGGDHTKALRVSRYLGDEETVPQVRFSIWDDDRAEAAVSLTEEEASRLTAFLAPPPRRPLLDHLRETLRL
ncbi:MAG TPA: hypothetical protein VGQ38_09560 [Gaiellaceae bacterium]|jgi:hypothetical protein|nr:hypothetical protein [Gaiellaceae bacterium]